MTKKMEIVSARSKNERLSVDFVHRYADDYNVATEAEKLADILQAVIPSAVYEELVEYLKAVEKNIEEPQEVFRAKYFEIRRAKLEKKYG